jgi:uncharacterized protein (TIGR02284 family)
MDKNKSVDVLNTFISITNERLNKYETITLQTNEPDLIDLLLNFQEKTQKCKEELISEVESLGLKPIKEPTIKTLSFLKIWLKLKSKFALKDREDLLNCCEYDEEVTINKYREILSNNFEFLTVKLQDILKGQLNSIKKDHDILKNLGDMLVTYRKFNLDN